MTRWMAGGGIAGLALLAVGALQAQQGPQDLGNAPGMPTIARTYILNQGATEAVPVTITAGGDVLPVELVGQPSVRLAPGETLPARVARQTWEYRQVPVDDPDAIITALNDAGDEGWEAVGTISLPRSGTAVLLKRPR